MLLKGVPQGSILRPLLFLFYINDLPRISDDIHFTLFADDTTALTSPSKMQNACDMVACWFAANKLALNVIKTRHMLFTFKNTPPPVLTIQQIIVEYVNDIKFLGCIINHKLSWQSHISAVCKKVAKGIALLRYSYNLFPGWLKRLIYFAYVCSHASYCLAIWGNAPKVHLNKICVLQRKAIRLMLGVSKYSHINPLVQKNTLLLLPELYNLQLAVFMFRNCNLHLNSHLFVSSDYVSLSTVSHPCTRAIVSQDYYLP